MSASAEYPDVARVAVVLTCFNEAQYIGPAVRSVLEQTAGACIEQIVIADDGSASQTIEVLRQIEGWDPRITVLYGSGGAGPAAQRNRAIAATQAPFIALLDGDDLWSPTKLREVLAAMANDEAVGLVYTGYWSFTGDRLDTALRAPVADITDRPDLTRAYFLKDPPIIPSTILLRRSAFEACGGFDAGIRVFEDTDLFVRLSRVCRFAFVSAPLTLKRTRPDSITGGRADLLAQHALVAFRAATTEPRLLALVPGRLSERARKLGNMRYLLGNVRQARQLLWLAVRLNFGNWRAWGSLFVACLSVPPLYRLISPTLRTRRAALGGQ